MANVGALRTTISLDSAQFQQSMAGVNRQLKSLQQEQKAVTSSGTGFARGVDELRKKSEVLSRTLELQEGKVRELKRRYEESRKATGENSKETQKASAEYNKAVAQMNRTETALKGITQEIERQTNPWLKLSRNMDNAGKKMQSVGSQMSTVGRNLSMRVTAPILGLGTAALTAGMNFEEGMSKVRAISGATGDDFEKLEAQAKDLGATTRFSATEAADGMSFLAMAGFETQEILESMPGLLDLAASSNMDLGRAADIASNIISGFGYEANEAGRVADVLARGSSTANTNVQQLGDAMAVVAPVASTLGLEIEGLSAAVGFMSDAGIQGQQAGRMLRQGFLRLANPTGAASDLIEELGINVFDADGNMKDMDAVVGELSDGLEGMSSEAQTAALSTIFGAESVAGWTALIDRGADELKTYTGELQDSEGAASDMASTMEDNAKGGLREFQSALEGAGIALSEHLLPAFTDAVEWGTELVRKFGELDDETQKQIITMGGLAAAIGPAALVAGNLTTAIGGIVRVGGSLASLLGRAGGAGLIGRIGLLGVSGPVGWAIAGVGALGLGIYALTRDSEKLHDINWDVVESLQAETEELGNLITQFEELENKNRLSTDEMLRYMDVLDELENANTEESIQRLTEEQQALLEKSGLTNEEMQQFLELNDKVIEQAPDTEKAISEQGNAYAENANALKELNAEKIKELQMTAERELINALENEKILLQEQKDLVAEINQLDADISQNKQDRLTIIEEIKVAEDELKGLQQELLALEGDSSEEAHLKRLSLQDQVKEQNAQVELLKQEQEQLDTIRDNLYEKFRTKQADLEVTEEELAKTDALKYEYEQLILHQADITAEKGRGLEKIDEELTKLDEEKEKLMDLRNQGILNTEEYHNQVGEIDAQIRKLEAAKTELENMNALAGETVYKEVKINESPNNYWDTLNANLSRPVSKIVHVRANNLMGNLYSDLPGYAEGTNSHPGGLALVGEEGFELAKHNNRWSMLDFGITDLPRGTQVFTHDESKKILAAMNRIPSYANGVSSTGEANRITSQLSDNNIEVVSLLRDIARGIREGQVIEIGGEQITRVVNENNAVADGLNYF